MKKQHLNQFINLFWTALCCIPLVVYWFQADAHLWLYVFLGLSLLVACLPIKFYRRIQLSNKSRFYESLGVKLARKFTQNGDLVNRLVRKNNPTHRIIKNRHQSLRYRKTMMMYEKYHYLGLIFFFLTALHALLNLKIGAAIWITLLNIVYNIYPILLQQYNKIRLERLSLK
ncbi:MAG: hypothetical protein HC880_09780 [Bacteroidia bacterium]|nr:hypothetical protein [Bacteroidia bacterium]